MNNINNIDDLQNENEFNSQMSINNLLIQSNRIPTQDIVAPNLTPIEEINNSTDILSIPSNEFQNTTSSMNTLFASPQVQRNSQVREEDVNNNLLNRNQNETNRNSFLLTHSPSPIMTESAHRGNNNNVPRNMVRGASERTMHENQILQATLGQGSIEHGHQPHPSLAEDVHNNPIFSDWQNDGNNRVRLPSMNGNSPLEINRTRSLSPVNFQSGNSILGGFLTQRLPSISPVNNLENRMDPSPLESPIDKDAIQTSIQGSNSPNFRRSKSTNIETITRRYFRQVMYGCNRDNCSTTFCAGNPNFTPRDINEATALSMTLSQHGGEHICPNVPEFDPSDNSNFPLPFQRSLRVDFGRDLKKRNRIVKNLANIESEYNDSTPLLTLELFQKLFIEAEALGSYDHFAQTMYMVFSRISLLSSSFPQDNNQLKLLCPLDIEQARRAYCLMMHDCPKVITASVLKGISTLFEKLKLGLEVIREKHISGLYLVLLNPMLMDSTSHHDILPRICDVFTTLSEKYIKLLCQYMRARRFVEDDPDEELQIKDEFQHVISVFQHFITMRIYSNLDNSITPNKDEYVMKATACLGILYRMNETHKLVGYEEFYNDVVNEHIEIKEDYPHFRSRNGFSFCNYPFILNPTTKGDILKVESMFQMRQELQDSFFRALFVGVNSPYLILEIRRDHIIKDALVQLSSKTPQDLKKQLKVQFIGEEGVDEGGVQKEFFQLLVRDMLDPKYGIFILKEESRSFWFNPNPLDDELSLEEYRLIGRLIGLAIYNAVILDLHFPSALYKKLMGKSVDIDDLEAYEPSFVKGLKCLLNFEGDVEAAYGWSFQIEYEVFGERYKHDLKPNGYEIMLNNTNREEFVNLYVDFILNKSIERQFNAFKEGFDHVCAGSTIQLFRPEEVELLVCGSSDFDFEALEVNTQYDGGFTNNSFVIKNFWKVAHGFTEAQKKQLLFFTTGSDRVPIGGLSKLQFVIAKNGPDSDRLPTSHTCFNVLLLPEYKTKAKLKERLLTAISNAEGFGMI
ncbi:HECT-domain-containing protein [Neoconidiobolus thromboides FSU 785]|nr:HECT-domain-containing protein [Neoconidiobolus thromboides FSU 785]